ncbi:MAG: DUF4369 domain-containing protein [Bacteroidaceae bacterium]|nr:DUF4369 domain-containing protein [Bacteroidaceae bacterium]
MKKSLYILYICVVAISMLASCGPGGNTFRIKGRFRDMQAGQLFIYNLSNGNARLDTLTVQAGQFQYKGEVDEVTPFILVFPNGVEQVIFVGPGYDLSYEATANDLKNYVVNGSDENKLMNQFREETYTLNPSMVTGTARTYIMNNPASPVAIYLLDRYFVQESNVEATELRQLLKPLLAHHPHNHHLLDIESQLTSEAKRQPGKQLPDITLVKRDYTKEKLWSTSSNYHLIAFWATWMSGGYDFQWRLRRGSESFRETGRLRVVAISLDLERYRWEETVRQDSLNGITHYCDGRGLESPVVKTFGIHSIPFYILTDKNHRVLDSGDDPAKIEEMLKKHIK